MCSFDLANLLKNGNYGLKPVVGIHNKRWILNDDDLIISFTCENTKGLNAVYMENRPGVIMPEIEWIRF